MKTDKFFKSPSTELNKAKKLETVLHPASLLCNLPNMVYNFRQNSML